MARTSGSLSHGDLSASSSARSIDSARSESSWTPYIVDFLTHGNQEKVSLSSSSGTEEHHSSSLLSDGAAKLSGGKNFQVGGGSPNKRLSTLKKRKTKEGSLVDEALEDTASSPNNSPKVCGSSLPELYRKKLEPEVLIMAKGDVSEQAGTEKKHELISIRGESEHQSSELKRKGLRLVPVAMVVKYNLGKADHI